MEQPNASLTDLFEFLRGSPAARKLLSRLMPYPGLDGEVRVSVLQDAFFPKRVHVTAHITPPLETREPGQ